MGQTPSCAASWASRSNAMMSSNSTLEAANCRTAPVGGDRLQAACSASSSCSSWIWAMQSPSSRSCSSGHTYAQSFLTSNSAWLTSLLSLFVCMIASGFCPVKAIIRDTLRKSLGLTIVGPRRWSLKTGSDFLRPLNEFRQLFILLVGTLGFSKIFTMTRTFCTLT